jgi:beta-glucosidase
VYIARTELFKVVRNLTDTVQQGLNATTGEHVDVDSFNLVGAQGALLKAIVQTGKPVVIVFQSGKPITEDWISSTSASLVQQFYPSEQGGNALAEIVYGDHSPSGRLSVSFPHRYVTLTSLGQRYRMTADTFFDSVGDLPIYYDYLGSGHNGEYDPGYYNADGSIHCKSSHPSCKLSTNVFVSRPQLRVRNIKGVVSVSMPYSLRLSALIEIIRFGYGLSYTNFTWSNVTLSKTNATASDSITASVSVTNSGSVDSQEVVQLYVVDVLGSVDRPNKRLKGFEKVMIKAGETADVAISINVADLGLYNPAMQYVIESGEFMVYMSQHSADVSKFASFYVS